MVRMVIEEVLQNDALHSEMIAAGRLVSDVTRHILVREAIHVRDDIESGRLIAPFDDTVKHDAGYYLVYPDDRGGQPKSLAFREWILREATEL